MPYTGWQQHECNNAGGGLDPHAGSSRPICAEVTSVQQLPASVMLSHGVSLLSYCSQAFWTDDSRDSPARRF